MTELHCCRLRLRHEKEVANQLRRLLQAAQVTRYTLFQMFGAFQEGAPDAMRLDVVPNLLVRVQLRRVGTDRRASGCRGWKRRKLGPGFRRYAITSGARTHYKPITRLGLEVLG